MSYLDLATHGFTIVRDALDDTQIRNIRRIVGAAYEAADTGRASPEVRQRVADWGGINVMWMEQAGVSPSRVESILDAMSDIATPIVGRCQVLSQISVFRRHTEPRTYIPWHIDADGAGTLAYDPCVNFWVPLDPVGVNRPALELVRRSHIAMRAMQRLDASNAERSDEWVTQCFGQPAKQVAVLDPGDVLIFDHYTLHRTQPMAAQAGPRISGEFRVRLLPEPVKVAETLEPPPRPPAPVTLAPAPVPTWRRVLRMLGRPRTGPMDNPKPQQPVQEKASLTTPRT